MDKVGFVCRAGVLWHRMRLLTCLCGVYIYVASIRVKIGVLKKKH